MFLLIHSSSAANQESELVSGPPEMDHQWNSGTQKYQLTENWLTQVLPASEKTNPNSTSRLARASTIRDHLVKPASFQQEAELNDSPNETDVRKFSAAANFPVKNIEMLRQELQLHQETVKSDDQAGDTARSSRLQILALASESLQRCVELEAQRERYQSEIEQIEKEDVVSKEQLEGQIEPAKPSIDGSTNSSILLTELKKKQDQLERNKQELVQIEAAIKFHSDRVIQIPIDRSKAIEKQKLLRESISASLADDLDSQISQLAQEIELYSLESELLKLEWEERRQEIGAKFDPVQRDLKLREVKRLELEVAHWERAAQHLRDREVAKDLQEANEKAADVHWSIEPLAARNAELVEEQKMTVHRIQKLRSTQESITAQYEEIVKRRTEIEKKIEAGGLTATNGMLLVELRRSLMTTGESHIQIRKLQQELRRVSLSNVSLLEERDELADPVAKVKDWIRSDDLESQLALTAKDFFTTKRDYLDQLIDDYKSYGKLISEVSQARKKLIEEINQTMAYVDKNAIWIRSSEPMRMEDFEKAQTGLALFFDSVKWYDITSKILRRMGNRLYESAIALFSVAFLIGANRRLRRRLGDANPS